MQFTFDLDIRDIVAKATAPERIQPMLDKAITEALSTALRDATGYNSPFSKQLKTQLAEALPHGLRIDDVAKFQHMLNIAMTSAVSGANAETLRAAMAQLTAGVLPDVPARIKMSELIEKAREGFHKEKHEAFYARFEPSEYSSGGGHLYLDSDESCRDNYRADMRLAFGGDGHVYALKLDGRDITPKSTPAAVGWFDGLLLSFYVGRTSLDIDMDADDVESACEAQYD